MCGFCFTSPRLPSARSWSDKTETKKFKENYGLKRTQNLLLCYTQCQIKNILGNNIGFVTYRRQREVSCFPISLAFTLPHLWLSKISLAETNSLEIWERKRSSHAKCSLPISVRGSKASLWGKSNCIPCLGQRGQKTIPCPAARTRITQIREYPPPRGDLSAISQRRHINFPPFLTFPGRKNLRYPINSSIPSHRSNNTYKYKTVTVSATIDISIRESYQLY